jgi:hypothetical protein
MRCWRAAAMGGRRPRLKICSSALSKCRMAKTGVGDFSRLPETAPSPRELRWWRTRFGSLT